MIQASEIRIGCLLDLEGIYHPVQAISTRFDGGCIINLVDGEQWKPIPLTPELLEKCGFEHRPNYKYSDNSVGEVFKLKNYLIGAYYTGEGYGISWEDSARNLCTVGRQLRHLHQLQNIFWCLTNTELTVTIN